MQQKPVGLMLTCGHQDSRVLQSSSDKTTLQKTLPIRTKGEVYQEPNSVKLNVNKLN